MKKLYLLIFICLVITGCSNNSNITEALVPDYDFRKTYWGASLKDVRTSEKSKLIAESEEALVYNGTLEGLTANITYLFDQDSLTSGMYNLNENFTNDNKYIEKYNELKEGLIKKYDSPERDDIDWSNTLFKDNPEDYGLAVSKGDLSFISVWDLPNHKIALMLDGNNFKSNLKIVYTTKSSLETIKTEISKDL